jgi:predicted amidohydrolase YtcJ
MKKQPVPFFLLLLCIACMKHVGTDGHPAVVVVAKRIRTGDPARPFVEALAMLGGRILKLGTRSEALDAAGAGAIVDELPGATVVPGLIDAHGHVLSLGQSLSVVQLGDATSEADAVARAKAAGTEAHRGEWLIGRGWNQNNWPGQQFPSRAALDAAFPTTPVFLSRVDGHAIWVNSAALAKAGITTDTRDPAGGRIVRDGRGEPTGVLVDNAEDLITLPAPTPEQHALWLKTAIETLARVGLTGVHDAGMDLATFELLQRWDAAGALPIRIYAMADGQGADRQTFLERGPYRGRHLVMRAVKLLADGALGSRGAALFEPYADDPKQTGLLLMEKSELQSRADAFAQRGFQVAVHAIGDRANAEVLDVLSSLPKGRHRVEHAQVLRADDLHRFAAAEIVASYQPTHATSDMPWAAARVGEERLKFAYAWRSMLDSGAHVAFGSDFPVERPDPLLGLYAARTRQDGKGQPPGGWHPEQRVSGEEALAGFTAGAAWAEFSESHRGTLKEGFDADFVALSVDPVEDPPAALLTAKVLVTVVDGVDVYRPTENRSP